MAVTIKGRAGTRVRFDVRYWEPGKTSLIDTTGYTARLQIRSLSGPRRVLLNVDESGAPGVLQRIAPGHWRVTLSPAMTVSLPQRAAFEVELVSDVDVNERDPLFSGIVLIDPQVVTNE